MRSLLLLATLLVPHAAFAIELDFYTYNGFEETVAAFKRLALVVSDNGFLVFVFVFTALGVTFGALKASYDGFVGTQINPIAFFIPTVLGVAVFKGAVLSTGIIHVYDPVRNAYEPVPGVPDLIVILAGTLSKIERGMIQITDTASANPYADSAGGINYALIRSALDADLNDRYLERSIVEYYNYCGMRAMGQSTSGNWGQNLMHGSDDLMTDFSNWTNGVLSVVYYPPGNDQGEVRTCTGAWAALSSRLSTASTFDAYLDSVCRTAGMNPLDAGQRARCQSLLAQTTTLYNVAVPGVLPYLRSIVLAKGVSDATNSADFSRGQRALVDRQVMAEAFGTSEAMNQWVPKVRAYMMATVLGLIPMVFLFLVTPLFKSAVALVLGLFAWLALWGTCDAVAVQMAVDAAADAFDQIREQRFGVEAILQSPEAAVQALGVFGKARLVALTLATALSAALFKFGGYAFAQLGQQWQGHLEQAGEAAGRTTLQPEAMASFQRSMMGAAGPQAALATSGFNNAAIGSAAQDVNTASFGGQYVEASVTGQSMSTIGTESAARTLGGTIGQNTAAEKFAGGGDWILGAISQTTQADTSRSLGRSDTERRLDADHFGSTEAAGAYDAGSSVASRIGLEKQLEGQTGSPSVTSNGVSAVSQVNNAQSIAANRLLTPDSALEMSIVQTTEGFSRARELGMPGAEKAGTGSAIDARASGTAAIDAQRALGDGELTHANLASRLGSVATGRNQVAGTIALGGDGRSIEDRIDYEQQRSSQISAFVPESEKEAFLNSRTDLNDQQRETLLAQPGGLMVSGAFDHDDPYRGIQVGDFSHQTSARVGETYAITQGGEESYGVSRTFTNAERLADPMALTRSEAVDIYRSYLFDDGHPFGAFSDQEATALANGWASVVQSRGLSASTTDQESTSANASADLRIGKGSSASAAAGVAKGGGQSASGSHAFAGGGLGFVHAEIGAVNNNFVLGAFREELETGLQAGRESAIRIYGEPSSWSDAATYRAQEHIAHSVDLHMKGQEYQFATQLEAETEAPTNWQKTDMRNEETDAKIARKVGDYVDGLFEK